MLRLLFTFLLCACGSTPPASRPAQADPLTSPRDAELAHLEVVSPYVSWRERRATFETHLSAPTTSSTSADSPAPDDAQVVEYSGPLGAMKGWFKPAAHPEQPAPAVLFFHSAFRLERGSWEAARPFFDAGYATFLPAMRGENGNPGTRELLYGEIDDARAALAWLVEQPGVDRTRVYVIGHSIGGGIASLLSLDPELPIRACAGIGGIYRAGTFAAWASQVPNEGLVRFDPNDPHEVSIRLFVSHLRDLSRRFYAFGGTGDPRDTRNAQYAERLGRELGVDVVYERVDGDHMGSLPPSMARFAEVIASDR